METLLEERSISRTTGCDGMFLAYHIIQDILYQIIQKVKDISGGSLEGSDKMLYPVLHRIEKEGFLISRWKMSDGGRLRRYYRITEKGRRGLDSERRQWQSVSNTLARLWKPLPSLD